MHVGDTLYLDGAVDPFLLDELKSYAPQPIRRLSLNSTGGLLEAAIEVAEWVRKNKIETYVRKDAVCMSACTLIFQAGVRRSAHRSAQFMFHSVRHLPQSHEQAEEIQKCALSSAPECLEKNLKAREQLQSSTDRLFSLYEEYGVTSDFYEKYKQFPVDPLWYLSGNYLQISDWDMKAEETLRFNIVQEIVDESI
jgi:hypothetical protein